MACMARQVVCYFSAVICVVSVLFRMTDLKAGTLIQTVERSDMTEELSNQLEELLESKFLADFRIVSEGEVIDCHKNILASRSDRFKRMFENELGDQSTNEMGITDLDLDTVKVIVKFIYSGTVDNIEENTDKLLEAAFKYNLRGLLKMCDVSLANKVNLENAIEMLVMGDMFNAHNLKKAAMGFIVANPAEIVDQENWKERLGKLQKLIPEVFEALAKSH